MESMDHGNAHGAGEAQPPLKPAAHRHKMMMHMTFFWGSKAEILFAGWPGGSAGMYVLALVFVFVLSFLVEMLGNSKLVKGGSSNAAVGLAQTALHTLRVGLAYMVMLAVMSFNAGVFLAVLAGHALGFMVFGSWVFKKKSPPEKPTSLPPPPPCSC